MRVHQVKVATKTITRICEDLGLPSGATAEAAPRGSASSSSSRRPRPASQSRWTSRSSSSAMPKAYQYTACDDCTRLRVLRLYRRQNTLSSIDFLKSDHRGVPVPHPQAAD